ncbi:MAG: DUF3373 domain-containing protein [Proteobacteria bacterium]|nr:DUF3373 domain-containing protein [Pseudomonadota bacterium]
MRKCFVLLMLMFFTTLSGKVFAQEQPKVEDLLKQIKQLKSELAEIEDRVSATERHTVTDKVSLGIDFRTQAISAHYKDLRGLPEWASSMMQLWAFNRLAIDGTKIGGNPIPSGSSSYTFNPTFLQKYGATLQPMFPAMVSLGFVNGGAFLDMNGNSTFDATADLPVLGNNSLGNPHFSGTFGATDLAKYQGMFKSIAPQKYDSNNDIMFTNRLRVNLDSKVSDNLSFSGRLAMYKTWADASGVKFYNGNMNTMNMDGNDVSVPTDDLLKVERAYFVYKNRWGKVDWHLSFGRRPATDGPPLELKANSEVGGSPLAHIINWQFDGASWGFELEELTGIPGASFKLCYGVGFESGVGNSYSLTSQNNVKDVHMLGFIAKLYDNKNTKVAVNYAHAFDITDGFTGTVIMPFTINALDIDGNGVFDEYYLNPNWGGYVSRMQPTANIGSMDMVNVLYQSKVKDINYFVSLALSNTNPDGRSMNPMMQFMGQDALLNDNGEQKSRTGYSVWAGIKAPVTVTKGQLGLEYNHGSKYWLNFTGAEDNVVGSKIAVRGDVYEVYYIQPITGKNFFLTLGAQLYDYDYTNSGSPLGAPKKISDVNALDSLMPVADKINVYYASLTYRF